MHSQWIQTSATNNSATAWGGFSASGGDSVYIRCTPAATQPIYTCTPQASSSQTQVNIVLGAMLVQTAMWTMNKFFKGFGQWIEKAFTHTPEKFIYVKGKDLPTEGLDELQLKTLATQHLAPIDEAIEIEGVKYVMDHFEKMLNDETYRNFQLTEINKVNKILGLKDAVFDADAIRKRIQIIKDERLNPPKNWKHRALVYLDKIAEKNAERLFNEVFTAEEIMKLETDKRLLISRGDLAFELLPNGGINQLLPNGEKQGWCLISKEFGINLKDTLIMKKLLLQSSPEIVLQIANKREPFTIAA